MNISIPKTLKFSLLAFACTLFLASCQKQNADVVKEEVVETLMKIKIGNRTLEQNAYATYCSANGKVFFNVSNNQTLLDTALLSSDFKVDDFLINYEKKGSEVSALGGASFTENIGGTNITSVVFDPSATIVIEEANAEFVKGSMTGSFRLLSGGLANYSVEFRARVIRTSPWCD
jgi:hypothetical protein